MNLVMINLFAEAYYSGNTYEETLYLLEEDYKRLKLDLNGISISVGELDGKHSDVHGDVEVETLNEEEQLTHNFDYSNDGNDLFYHLAYNELHDEDELSELIDKANNYIETLDSKIEVSYIIKKSQKEAFDNFYKEINK